ncbi:MAG: DUF4411 family protein [Flavobacteriales bacterium]|jgi:hypothetical protein|nr:DUF4411 family protein [Flavobacteriales bacterium]MEB2342303.1 DUF4411 family protein [Flavobacteriia bacterium]
MSNGAKPLYCIDTNSLMDWQARYYPTDIFPGMLSRMDQLVSEDRLVAPALVREEVEAVGAPELVAWVKAHRNMFVPNADVLAGALAIQHRFPGLLDPRATYEEADAYLIALAQRTPNGIVVTQETPASEKSRAKRSHYIPDVCREMGIPCISILGLMRKEGWAF